MIYQVAYKANLQSFVIGDRVANVEGHKGLVMALNSQSIYSVLVKMDNGYKEWWAPGVLHRISPPSALERDFTPLERHRTGDHTECGSSCPTWGYDLREAPIYDAVLAAQNATLRGERGAQVVGAIPSPPSPVGSFFGTPEGSFRGLGRDELRTRACQLGVKGASRMNKEQLVHALRDHYGSAEEA